jgi:paraquat-inducible protein A
MLPADARLVPGKKLMKKTYILLLLAASVYFFIMGLTHPILETGLGLLNGRVTINHEFIYLSTAFQYFFNKGEVFIAVLLLVFTIILPVIKYIFITLAVFNIRFKNDTVFFIILDVVNKWSMLDVFIVALVL